MKFVFFDENGRVLSSHNDDTRLDLPPGAYLITDAQWGSRFDLLLDNGVVVDMPAEISVAKAITLKRTEFNQMFTQAMQQITTSVPADEIASWDKQETEARAWTADNAAVTPLIDAIASSRGMDKAVLVGKIITKADAFAAIVGDLIGKRQALEDQIDALPEAATESDITSITWS